MKDLLEELWSEHFAEECAAIHTEEERALIKRAAEMHKTANELLTKEQCEAVEEYIEALYEIQGFFVKRAFFKGCEFTTAFLLKVGDFEKR